MFSLIRKRSKWIGNTIWSLKINRKYDLKPSKLFSSIRKRLKSISNSMRMLQKCFRPKRYKSIENTIWSLQNYFRLSENALNRKQIVCKGFKSVFVHQKTLKYNSKYDLKPSKLFSSVRKRFKSKANSMQVLQKHFRSSENALNQWQKPSENFKIVFVHPKTLKIDIK